MLEVDQVHECKKLAGQGVSIRQISVQLEVSRNTVRRYLRGKAVPGVYQSKQPRARPVVAGVVDIVKGLLTTERRDGVPRKQRFSAARIYRLLKLEHGFLGSESTVRKLVRDLRGDLRDPLSRAYVPLDYEPGIDAQVDFFEAVVDIAGEGRVKVFALLVRPCFSGKAFLYIAPNQTQEALFEGLIRAFEFFGGVFRKIWFDNLTPAVRKVLCGRKRELQKAFAAFMAHYGFEAEFCRPACGNDKGGVENHVKFARSEVFTPLPMIDDRSELHGMAAAFMDREEHRTMRGRDRTIGELWKLEQPNLLPLPSASFEVGQLRTCRVSNRSWISLGTNFYSVPAHLAGSEVQVRLGAETISISSKKGVEAVHARRHGRQQMSLEIGHYLPLLERKLRAVDRALPVKQWLSERAPCWQRFLDEVRRRDGDYEGSKSFIEAVRMCEVHGTGPVTEALTRALSRPAASLAVLRFELDALAVASRPTPPKVDYDGPEVKEVSASDYDSMLEVCHV